ncbi:MAG: ABC transporter ATP-binding protein [Planctomycetota bacterium]
MRAIHVHDLELVRPRGGFHLGPISIDLAAGTRTALVGPSGSGKTTLLRCIAGLESASRGRIAFDDRVVQDGARAIVPPAARGIGFVFQDGALWPHLDAVQHLRFVRPSLSLAEAREQLARVGLAERAHGRPSQLSGGEAQRLALARALAGDPEVLLLDEPLGSVDVHLRDEIAILVRDMATERRLTLVVVTHDRDEALAMADELVVLRAGKVVESGAAGALLHDPHTAFTARFLGRAACLPLRVGSDGVVASALARVTSATVTSIEDHVHVVLADDVELDGPDATCTATVLHVRHDPLGGALAVVALDGQPVHVRCNGSVNAGQTVGLRLRGQPRILPRSEGSPSGAQPVSVGRRIVARSDDSEAEGPQPTKRPGPSWSARSGDAATRMGYGPDRDVEKR